MEDLEKLKKEIKLELDYALRLIGDCGDYKNESEFEAASDAADFLYEHIEPIIYEKLEEAYNLGRKRKDKNKSVRKNSINQQSPSLGIKI